MNCVLLQVDQIRGVCQCSVLFRPAVHVHSELDPFPSSDWLERVGQLLLYAMEEPQVGIKIKETHYLAGTPTATKITSKNRYLLHTS